MTARMVLCAVRRQLLRSSSCGSWVRLLQRRSSGCVYSSVDGFNQEEIREKLQAFPGGSVDLLKQESGIAVMTVNYPSRMNAFSGGMMVDLEERVSQLESWTDGKGLIVHGAAGTFCSGSDLNAVRAISNPTGRDEDVYVHAECSYQTTQAASDLCCSGGGRERWEEALNSPPACDFRLMASGSVIQFVHKHMGLVPGWGGAARLVRIVGSQNALKLLGGALKVDPELGQQIGLADGVLEVPQTEEGGGIVLQRAEDWLRGYTTGPAPVIQAVKKVTLSGRELPLSEALRTERDVFGTVWGGPANLQALTSKPKHR